MAIYMFSVGTIGFYVILFFAVYIQVFLLVTYLDNRKAIPRRKKSIVLESYPTVTILVPCYNEEKTIGGTVDSLLKLEYPQDKFNILLIDDGSQDGTLSIMRSYEQYPNVSVLTQKNTGKHEALNAGLRQITTEFVATLDADSFITPFALQRVISMFHHDQEIQSVVSSILIYKPKNLVQIAQKAEYEMSVYVKSMLAHIGGLHVTPGPFSVFRRSVFDTVGMYRQAYNTEDGEMALRIQKHGFKIGYCADSYVYTVAPDTIAKLFKQRVRWTYGFLRNLMDYREMLFKKRYAGLAFFTLPSAIISFITVVVVSTLVLYSLAEVVSRLVQKISAAGVDSFSVSFSNIEWYVSTAMLIMIALYVLVLIAIMAGRIMAQQKKRSWKDLIMFVIMSGTIAPVWIIKSMIDASMSRQSRWK